MKSKIGWVLVFSMFLVTIFTMTVFANTEIPTGLQEKLNNAVVLHINNSRAFVNSYENMIDSENTSVRPIIVGGRTLVPVRFISEALGAKVDWIDQTATAKITINNNIVEMKINSNIINVNGKKTEIEVPAQIINGRTFVPLRTLAEALNKKVFWDDSGLIIISNKENILDNKESIAQLNNIFSNIENTAIPVGEKIEPLNSNIPKVVKTTPNEVENNNSQDTFDETIIDDKTTINSGFVSRQGSTLYFGSRKSGLVKQTAQNEITLDDSSVSTIFVDSDWIYYGVYFYSIYKIKTDGTGKTKVVDGYDRCWTESNGWIYYWDNGFYKIKTDGSSKTKLSNDNVSNINIIGDWIFYNNDSDFTCIYKIKTDGSQRTKISDKSSRIVNIVDNIIYYQYGSDSRYNIYKMNIDGTENAKINSDRSSDIRYADGWLYYVNERDNNSLYRIKINGRERTKIINDYIQSYNVVGNAIYYRDSYCDKLQKTNVNAKVEVDDTKEEVTDNSSETNSQHTTEPTIQPVTVTTNDDAITVRKTNPLNGATNVNLLDFKNYIVVYFNKAVKRSTGNIRVYDSKGYDVKFVCSKPFDDMIAIYCEETLKNNTTYTVNLCSGAVIDDSGNLCRNIVFSFTTAGAWLNIAPNTTVAPIMTSTGNLINGGNFAIYGDYLFYRNVYDEGKLYQMNLTTKVKTKLSDIDSIGNIIIINKYLYFTSSGGSDSNVYKINLNSSYLTIPPIGTDFVRFIKVANGWIYFQNYSSGYADKIYRMRTDGTGKMMLIDSPVENLNVVGRYMYYIRNNGQSNGLFKRNIDGSGEVLIRQGNATDINVSDGWIYFNDKAMFRMKTDGSCLEMINSEYGLSLNVSKNSIFYCPIFSKDKGIFKINIDGSGKVKLTDDTTAYNICVFGDWIYYQNEIKGADGKNIFNIYRVKTDGSNREAIK